MVELLPQESSEKGCSLINASKYPGKIAIFSRHVETKIPENKVQELFYIEATSTACLFSQIMSINSNLFVG